MSEKPEKKNISQERTNKEKVIIAFFIGVIFSICISLYGLHMIADNVKELIVGFILIVSILSILFFFITLNKEWVFKKAFGISHSDINDIKTTSTELLGSLVKRDWNRAEQKIDETISKASAWYVWISYRRWVIFVFYSLFIGFAGLLGSVLIYNQNRIIERQDVLLREQNGLISTQTIALTSIEKRNSNLTQLNNVINSIDDELKSDYGSNATRDLSPELIGRISALTNLFKPYKAIEDDTLSQTISLERGQLLIYLVNSNLSKETYDNIYSQSDFSYSELRNATLNNRYFKRVRLNNSRIEQAYLNNSDFSNAELKNVNFKRTSNQFTKFDGANIRNSNFQKALLDGANFNQSILDDTDFTSATIRNSKFNNLKSSKGIKIDDSRILNK